MTTDRDFAPGDRVALWAMPVMRGVVVDDEDTDPGMVAVIWRDDVCSGVWYLLPDNLELICKAEEE